jgi:hypothetical protein
MQFRIRFPGVSLTEVYPKYSGLVQPSIQQLWKREAPIDGRTTMSTESVCQVARSCMEVGSFHKRLVVRFMIFTESVRNILDTSSYFEGHFNTNSKTRYVIYEICIIYMRKYRAFRPAVRLGFVVY